MIHHNIPLHTKNWFGTGGNAQFYSEPTTPELFSKCILFAKDQNISIALLGQGANILISDSGYDGLVIRPHLNAISITNQQNNTVYVKAEAGASIANLIEFCLNNNIVGLEEFSGIPGSVGGAIYINLHYFEFLLSQFLDQATLVEKNTGNIITVHNSWFNFGYNQSKLIEENHYLIDATFKLKYANQFAIAHAQGRRQEIIRHRNKKYPTQKTCGSFFRNFLPHEVTLANNNQKIIWVAYYLDKIGVKGSLQIGGAMVSHQHANMIINTGNATSQDIIELAHLMQTKVKKEFNIIPEAECRLLGFKKYPLLTNS